MAEAEEEVVALVPAVDEVALLLPKEALDGAAGLDLEAA